jgi:hypothetical protein
VTVNQNSINDRQPHTAIFVQSNEVRALAFLDRAAVFINPQQAVGFVEAI